MYNEEVWEIVPGFPNYQVSNLGRVWNVAKSREVRQSHTQFGHLKVNLTDENNCQTSRSVAMLVATAFIEPLNWLCDAVMVLDGNYDHVAADNLTWRPSWFVWKYVRQIKTQQPTHYKNLPVVNLVTGRKYESIIEAGMAEGLLFDDIWQSCHNGHSYFPHIGVFEIDHERKAFLQQM